VKISVCIPAYKNAAFLKRCLDSLVSQTFKDVEVILSDDSPDDSVQQIADEYKTVLNLRYLKNTPSKGTPANWNFALQHASGEYIKLMHDDDWFATEDALQQYYDCLQNNPSVNFCFSAYNNVHLNTGSIEPVFCSPLHRQLLKRNRYNLFKKNFIGPPSAVFQRNIAGITYDERLKWLVDFEGYIRFLGDKNQFEYLDHCLVNIGLSDEQVTQSTKEVKEVVIPESLYFLQKHGEAILKNIWVYDYYWRMCRNFSIKNIKAITSAGWEGSLPGNLKRIIAFQQKIPAAILKMGVLSKMLMSICFLKNK
jgi:glycosyltransferase involved in cell wall biosynthesis